MIGEWRALWSRRAGGDFSDSYNVGRIVADDAARGHGAEPIADTPAATVGNEAELPFIIVQLPRWIDQKEYNSGIDRMFWPHIREAQADAARIIPDVYLAVTFDTGEFNNIHPTDKRPVGERIALQVPYSFRWHPPAKRPMSCRCALATPTACISDRGLGATTPGTYRQFTRLDPGKQNPCGP